MVILETRDLVKIYGEGDNEVRALDGVSLKVEQGEMLAIVGSSGSGKSTLLNMIGGLDDPTGGSVTVRGRELVSMPDEEKTIFRRRNIGFVFQNYNLMPIMDAYSNIILPMGLDGRSVDEEYLDQIIATLGIRDKLDKVPGKLSGGQQQRVAIARALSTKPAIVLADEPTGNLDSKTSMDVVLLLKETNTKFGQTTVIITHNEEIAQMADRVIRLEDGKIVGEAGREQE